MEIKVSIIIPVYNVEKYVGECIRSIMGQTYTNYECFIVDDCGTDKSIDIVEDELSRYTGNSSFIILKHDKNKGISAARNTALRQASGDYIFFVDSDDILVPNALELLVKMTEKYPGVDLVQGNIDIFPIKKKWEYDLTKFPEFSDNREWIEKSLLQWDFPVTVWAKLYRRDIIGKNGIEFLEGFIHEDVMWVWSIHKYINSVAISCDPCYRYRSDNDSSLMNQKDRTKSFLSYLKFYSIISSESITDVEKRFVFHLLAPARKLRYQKCVKDISLVESKLDETIRILKEKNVDDIFVTQLRMWHLPVWIIDSYLFSKLYYLWGKYHNILD